MSHDAHDMPSSAQLHAQVDELQQYQVGRRIQFLMSRNVYQIIEVEGSRITFARTDDPDDFTTEEFRDLQGIAVLLS